MPGWNPGRSRAFPAQSVLELCYFLLLILAHIMQRSWGTPHLFTFCFQGDRLSCNFLSFFCLFVWLVGFCFFLHFSFIFNHVLIPDHFQIIYLWFVKRLSTDLWIGQKKVPDLSTQLIPAISLHKTDNSAKKQVFNSVLALACPEILAKAMKNVTNNTFRQDSQRAIGQKSSGVQCVHKKFWEN